MLPETGCPPAIQESVSETDTTCTKEGKLAHGDDRLATITGKPGISRTVCAGRAQDVIDVAEIWLVC